ncbi:helix-turn-helix transcriptional regulator [Parabacteroides sp. BX2]|jgi:DNA-binding CsgD family transcriptional regulator|uniref:Helix-turn-helix transcriptional regulator n=1 Tax=Parabacteroides segnis TaxID=2763058 RepID=A0ABR7E1S3_9BACT|nr:MULTISPECIES: LuxR C-terminal-related transcriptional regulator [Parabacteroides]MBC5643713.1 helix-turn-helix transcriptional regulator [Parabacteroides segnis]MCM0713691.1 LuxR C-terminal-related transcriptional regulator [Parabacteroides sp. TA-V-105]
MNYPNNNTNFSQDAFFKGFQIGDEINDLCYQKILPGIEVLTALSRINTQVVYIIDYFKKNYLYVSDNPMFLCNHSVEEVQQTGPPFYKKIVPPEDLEMLFEIKEKASKLFYQYPVEERSGLSISYDFRMIQPDSKVIMVNYKSTPISLTPNGDLWLALCLISLSSKKTIGNVIVNSKNDLRKYSYSFKSKKWKEISIVKLSIRENEVLRLSAQGYSNKNIANLLYIDINTVKSHKKNIFQKLDVKNINEAITFANNNNLL